MLKSLFFPVITLFTLTILSCQKQDLQITKIEKSESSDVRFFTTASTNSVILRINKELQLENSKIPFVDRFVKIGGYPKWEKGFYVPQKKNIANRQSQFQNTDSTYIILVVSENDDVVTGALIANLGDTSSYNLVLINDFRYWGENKDKFLLAMMVLDNRVYGYSKFKIRDTSAFNHSGYLTLIILI